MKPLLEINDLSIECASKQLLENVHLQVNPGEIVGIIGDSGSGKTLTTLSILHLLPNPAKLKLSGEILFQGENLLKKTEKEMEQIRGPKIGMVFQDPMSSLNPTMKIGSQITEGLIFHKKISRQEARERALQILEKIEIPSPKIRIDQYPHELSGGMRQRIMIGIAIACSPELLIADEPTTSLDVTIQAQILHLLKNLRKKEKMALLIVSHDLGVIAGMCERVIVMHQGKVVEEGLVDQIYYHPKHSYTKKLLNASMLTKQRHTVHLHTPLFEINRLTKIFKTSSKSTVAFSDINLSIMQGEILGLIGESGCGKTSLAKTLLRLQEPTEGSIFYKGENLTCLSAKDMQKMRRQLQIIFQNPYSTLNPRMTVEEIISEPLEIHNLVQGSKKKERIRDLLNLVGLPDNALQRYPYEFSGGQRQRISIARTLAVEPKFIVCDEPLSSLDLLTQHQILQLLNDLHDQLGLTYLFIGHDLQKVAYLSHRIVVMYLGHITEIASSQKLYTSPLHPYTQALISAIPLADPIEERQRPQVLLKGSPSSKEEITIGCPFYNRCPYARPLCDQQKPQLKMAAPDHFVACHFYDSLDPKAS